jgi:hypothetical protein
MEQLRELVMARVLRLGLSQSVLTEWGEWTDKGLKVLTEASDKWLWLYLKGPNAALWRAMICDAPPKTQENSEEGKGEEQ